MYREASGAKSEQAETGQQEPSQPQTTVGARLVPTAEPATLPGAPLCLIIRLDQIRQPKLFEFQVFPLRV